MQRIGLYYPYVHFRDDAWLKAAALYWPRMARVVPPGYPVDDPLLVRTLRDELDFVVDVDPQDAATAVAAVFLRILDNEWNRNRLRHMFLVTEGPWGYSSGWVPSDDTRYVRVGGDPPVVEEEPWPFTPTGTPVPERRLTGLHWEEVDPRLREALMDANLAVATERSALAPARGRKWLAMPPALGWTYKGMLTQELARRTGYVPATDQDRAHDMIGHWDERAVISTCMEDDRYIVPFDPARDFAGRLGTLAVAGALPAGLADVPAEKIVKVRKDYAGEFTAFTDAVSAAAADLEEHLAGIEDAAALREYLRLELARRVEEPLEDLRGALRGLGLRTADTVLNFKFELGTLTTAMAGTLGEGPVTVAGVTFGLATMHRGMAEARDAQIKGSPVGFLLRVQHHLPQVPAKRRALRAIRRALGIGP